MRQNRTIMVPTDPRSPAITPGVPRLPVLNALTSVRFFAALHVALYHLIRPFTRWGFFTAAMAAGYEGVSFFFVLSGFILTYSHAKEYELGRGNAKKFWIARFARIYPVYFLSVIFAGLAGIKQFHNKLHWIAYVADLLMLQAWSMRMVNFFNSGAWTLSCEVFFYLVFPLVLTALRPKTRSSALLYMTGLFLLAMAAPVLCIKFYYPASFFETTGPLAGSGITMLVSKYPVFALPQFLAGISLGWFFLRFKPQERTAAVMAPVGFLLLGAALFFANYLPFIALHNGLLIPVYALIILGLSQPNWMTRALSGRTLVLLGEASFAFYLFHLIIIAFTDRYNVPKTWFPAVWRLVIAIPLSVLLHIFVERPCRRTILGWWAKRHPAEMRTV